MTQSEAKKFCEEEQEVPAHLVEIDSLEENRAITAEIQQRDFFSRKIEFWLGITDRHSEGHWGLAPTGILGSQTMGTGTVEARTVSISTPGGSTRIRPDPCGSGMILIVTTNQETGG